MLVKFGTKYGFKLMCRLDDILAIESKKYTIYFHMRDGKVIETDLSDDDVSKTIDEAQFPDKFKAEVNK